jgi:hypothetical protein
MGNATAEPACTASSQQHLCRLQQQLHVHLLHGVPQPLQQRQLVGPAELRRVTRCRQPRPPHLDAAGLKWLYATVECNHRVADADRWPPMRLSGRTVSCCALDCRLRCNRAATSSSCSSAAVICSGSKAYLQAQCVFVSTLWSAKPWHGPWTHHADS